MYSRARLVLLACLVVTFASVLSVVDAPRSEAGVRLTLARPRATADAVVLKGRAPAGTKVRLVRRTDDRWVRIGVDRANRRGRYRVTIQRPTARRWVVRAETVGTRSRKRVVTPLTASPTTDPDVTPTDPPLPDDACGSRLQKADGSLWECTFVDEFEGAALDTGKWLAQDTSISGVTIGPGGCHRNEPWTIEVADGSLRLSAQRTETEFTCKSPFGDFQTDLAVATVTTKGRFNQAYGRFAFRAKMPDLEVAGAHSALWLYPDQHTYGRWPLSGEIDVAEWYSALPQQVFPSVHYVDGLKNVLSGHDGIVEDASAFHTYELEWTPTTMRFYYDGQLTFRHSWSPLAPLLGGQPFDKPFNTVLTQAWGGLWNGRTEDTPDRVTMKVDWVRVWK